MNTTQLLRTTACLLGLAALPLTAAPFDSGSNGSLGDLVVSNTTIIVLPPDGVLHYKRVEIQDTGVVLFQKNALNTPVTLLAQEEVVIKGILNLDGTGASGADPGRGGPGGFDGGRGNSALPAGPGKGPGGGKAAGTELAGPGAFASRGETGGGRAETAGEIYGDPLLLPIIGGSGGGGRADTGDGGGGGGGAILIASNVRISVPTGGSIYARGAEAYYNDGAGGGIRLVAPVIEGVGSLHAHSIGSQGGAGRVRLDSPNATQAKFNYGRSSVSFGALMLTKLPNEPKLNLLNVGGQVIPLDAVEPVSVIFPSGAPAERIIKVQASGFNAVVPVRVALIPDHGERVIKDIEINNTAAGAATVEVTVTFPLNVPVTVNVWTR